MRGFLLHLTIQAPTNFTFCRWLWPSTMGVLMKFEFLAKYLLFTKYYKNMTSEYGGDEYNYPVKFNFFKVQAKMICTRWCIN